MYILSQVLRRRCMGDCAGSVRSHQCAAGCAWTAAWAAGRAERGPQATTGMPCSLWCGCQSSRGSAALTAPNKLKGAALPPEQPCYQDDHLPNFCYAIVIVSMLLHTCQCRNRQPHVRPSTVAHLCKLQDSHRALMTKDLLNSGLLRDRYVADLFERLQVNIACSQLNVHDHCDGM